MLRKTESLDPKRIQEERDTNRRGRHLLFPPAACAHQADCIDVPARYLCASRFENESLLRGVYFTSGTQEGTPIDRIMGVLAGVYGMERQELPAFRGRPRAFFISRLLKGVIFPEAELAGLESRIERRRKWFRLAAYTPLLLF